MTRTTRLDALGQIIGFHAGSVFLGYFLISRANDFLVDGVASQAATLLGQGLVGPNRGAEADSGCDEGSLNEEFHACFLCDEKFRDVF